MKTTKILTLLTALVMLLSFAACSGEVVAQPKAIRRILLQIRKAKRLC